jgi:hypothetical protein
MKYYIHTEETLCHTYSVEAESKQEADDKFWDWEGVSPVKLDKFQTENILNIEEAEE